MTFEQFLEKAMPILEAIGIFILGHFVVVYIKRIVKRLLAKGTLDKSFQGFIVKSLSVVLHVLIILSVLATLGISITGIVAALSAAVVAIGVALKDSLGNVAGGIVLLISPRFATGDFIEAEEDAGTVMKIDLLHTTIKTPDNRVISIPNGVLVNCPITNFSGEEIRRVEVLLSVPYSADTTELRAAFEKVMNEHPKVLKDNPILARVMTYGPNSVDFTCRSWTNSEDYWDVYFDLTESLRGVLKERGLDVPFNQMDVHIIKD